MNKSVGNFVLLWLSALLTASAWGQGFAADNYDGMQLAWVRLPEAATEKDAADAKKAKAAQPATTKPLEVKPSPPAVVKPAAVPMVKPAPAVEPPARTVPVEKPVQPRVPAPAVGSGIRPVAPVMPKAVPHEARKTRSVQWLIGFGIDFGGEELGRVTYSDGSTASAKANNGLILNLGAIIANGADSPFSTQLTLGYKSGGPRLWNNDVTWTAIPLEIIEHYHPHNFRMGLGISYQLNPQFKVNLPSASFVTQFNNALGLIIQAGWAPKNEHYSVDLRYTAVKFQASDAPAAPLVDGNVGGLYLNYYY